MMLTLRSWIAGAAARRTTGILFALCSACGSTPVCDSGTGGCHGDDGRAAIGNGASGEGAATGSAGSGGTVAEAGKGSFAGAGEGGVSSDGTERMQGAGEAGGSTVPIANAKFCSELKVDGESATLRLTLGGRTFEATNGTCAECQELPVDTPLVAELSILPQNISLRTFDLKFRGGEYIILATVQNGVPGLLTAAGKPDRLCESLDPFEGGPPAVGPANIKFCQDFRVGGEDTSLRLSVNGETFDAATGTCSPCSELPEDVPLDFEVRLMPDDIVGSSFTDTLDSGPGVLMVNANGDVTYYPGRFYQECEDLDPF